MSIFTGAGVALVTPFKEDLSVDYDQLEKFIDFQIDNGTDSIVICGTSGEASTMSHDEQIEVVSACVSHVNGRVPVIAGAGAHCTDEALRSVSWPAMFCESSGSPHLLPDHLRAPEMPDEIRNAVHVLHLRSAALHIYV